MAEQDPIISKWWKDPVEHETTYVGAGGEAAVHRQSFLNSEGEKNVFVSKETEGREAAKQALEVYQNFKKANLPVVRFLKMNIGSSAEEGEKDYFLLMEDLTENDTYEISNRTRKRTDDFGIFAGASTDPNKLARQMFQALAVIHNNGYYNFHDPMGLGFVTRKPKMPSAERKVDFKIIDYTNFRKQTDSFPNPLSLNKANKEIFEKLAARDFEEIVKRLTLFIKSNFKEFKTYYDELRAKEILSYDPER